MIDWPGEEYKLWLKFKTAPPMPRQMYVHNYQPQSHGALAQFCIKGLMIPLVRSSLIAQHMAPRSRSVCDALLQLCDCMNATVCHVVAEASRTSRAKTRFPRSAIQ